MKHLHRWYRRKQLFSKNIPGSHKAWLFDASSLTARLVALCGKDFNVRVLSQHWQKLESSEAAAMQISHEQAALVRQVLLCCGDTPLVYARSVIPALTVTGAQRRYANMGRRPLGAMLFADRSMRREPVMVSRLPADHPVLARLRKGFADRPEVILDIEGDVDSSVEIWGRRSVFRVSGKPLLVSEFFLPALFERSASVQTPE